MPTGSGKTPLIVAMALLSKQPTCIVTESRALQDQALSDFASIGLVDIRGRRNYPCLLRDDYTCEDGYEARCPHKGTISCPSSQAEMRAAASPLVITNYDKWMAAKKFGQGMSHFTRLILDEGHAAPDALARNMQVTLHAREIEEVLGLDFPPSSRAEDMVVWKAWAAEARATADIHMLATRNHLAGVSDPKAAWVRQYTHLRHLTRRLAILATASPTNWVVEERERGYQFDPIRPGRYAEATLLLRMPHITIVSATLSPKTLFLIGLSRGSFDFQEFASDFNPARCPIYYVPTMRVDARADTLAMLWLKLDQIAARRRDRNGIVHTISFARRDEILASSRFAGSMMINEKGEPATEMVETFKDSYPGAILVSPSVGTGFDFAMRAAEWQFVCKIPFPPPSRVLRARTEDDREYPYYLAMQKLVQICGRLVRSREDQGETIIGDTHLDWFLPRYGHLAPKSFHGFFQRRTVLPQPPPRL